MFKGMTDEIEEDYPKAKETVSKSSVTYLIISGQFYNYHYPISSYLSFYLSLQIRMAKMLD